MNFSLILLLALFGTIACQNENSDGDQSLQNSDVNIEENGAVTDPTESDPDTFGEGDDENDINEAVGNENEQRKSGGKIKKIVGKVKDAAKKLVGKFRRALD